MICNKGSRSTNSTFWEPPASGRPSHNSSSTHKMFFYHSPWCVYHVVATSSGCHILEAPQNCDRHLRDSWKLDFLHCATCVLLFHSSACSDRQFASFSNR